jgi:hypothetical protein
VSSVFWCLLNEDILKRVPIVGFKSGRGVGREIKDGDRGGSSGRVSSLAVLSHHIDVTRKSKGSAEAGSRTPSTSPTRITLLDRGAHTGGAHSIGYNHDFSTYSPPFEFSIMMFG